MLPVLLYPGLSQQDSKCQTSPTPWSQVPSENSTEALGCDPLSNCHHSKLLHLYCVPATAQRWKPQIKVPKAGEQQIQGSVTFLTFNLS